MAHLEAAQLGPTTLPQHMPHFLHVAMPKHYDERGAPIQRAPDPAHSSLIP